jgi:hypothetical protein
VLPPPPSSESDDDDGLQEMFNEQMEIQKKLVEFIDEKMPAIKRHLGSASAKFLKETLCGGSGRDMFVVYEGSCALIDKLVESWATVTLPTLTEAQKQQLRGKEAMAEWDREVVEEEIRLKKSLFLLEDIYLEDSEEDSEEDLAALPPSLQRLKPADVTINRCRGIPKLYVPEDVDENIRAIGDALEETLGGLEVLTTHSAVSTIEFWMDCLERTQSFFQEDNYSEAFIVLLALSNCMFRFDHWFTDNEDLKTVANTMKQLGAAWTKCLTKPFDSLGVVGKKEDLLSWLTTKSNEMRTRQPTIPKFQFLEPAK